MFVRKYDANGALVWARDGIAPTKSPFDAAVVVDAQDGIYVSASREGAFPGQTSFGGDDRFIHKFDSSGNSVWVRQFGTSRDEFGILGGSLAAAGPDSLYAAGGSGGIGQNADAFVTRIVRANRPPAANAGPDMTVTADANCEARVQLTGLASSDPDGDPLTYTWTGHFTGGSATGPSPVVTMYGEGPHAVTLTVSDGKESSSDTAVVTVIDRTPPSISGVSSTPNMLWPPNGKMVPVRVSISLTPDNCAGAVSCGIVSVRASDAEGGSGNSVGGDWEITGERTVNLRASRSGVGGGRTYIITVECTDIAGNRSQSNATFLVPHDQRK